MKNCSLIIKDKIHRCKITTPTFNINSKLNPDGSQSFNNKIEWETISFDELIPETNLKVQQLSKLIIFHDLDNIFELSDVFIDYGNKKIIFSRAAMV